MTISCAGDDQIHLISIAPSHPPDIHTTHTYLGSFVWTGIFLAVIWKERIFEKGLEDRKNPQPRQQGMKEEVKHTCSSLLPQASLEQVT